MVYPMNYQEHGDPELKKTNICTNNRDMEEGNNIRGIKALVDNTCMSKMQL